MYQLGVDVGGTFTDLVLFDEEKGEFICTKAPSTYPDPSIGILEALRKSRVPLKEVSRFAHATTFGINLVVQRKGVKVGLITTKGFRDVLEIMRESKGDIYDFRWRKPKPLVPRHLRMEVPERLNFRGEVIEPLDEAEVEKATAYLRERGVEGIAIVFLYSFMNPVHEKRARDVVKACYPEAYVSVSHEILPEIREYERSSTTVIDAYLKPRMDQYLTGLQTACEREGYRREITIFKSNGGITSLSQARQTPVNTISAGPAAGLIATVRLCEAIGRRNVISFDMGGTSCDVSLVHNGGFSQTTEWQIEEGIPVKVPFIDIHSIGAGGGTIARFEAAGVLKVGPESAGANPGPACYGLGGDKPTVTDANVVLRRIDPSYFLGGDMALQPERAVRAIEGEVARYLNTDVCEAAQGILDVVDSNMVHAIQLISVERGFDPREFSLFAFGGAGGAHACKLASELGMPEVIVPNRCGTFSALGLITADARIDLVQSLPGRLEELDMQKVSGVLDDMEGRARDELKRDNFRGEILVYRSADLRYVGQNFEVNVPLPAGALTEESKGEITNRFREKYSASYGMATNQPLQLLSVRMTVTGLIPPASMPRIGNNGSGDGRSGKPLGRREVYFGGETISCPVYRDEALRPDQEIRGPVIVERRDSTIFVHPEYTLSVDPFGNLLMRSERR